MIIKSVTACGSPDKLVVVLGYSVIQDKPSNTSSFCAFIEQEKGMWHWVDLPDSLDRDALNDDLMEFVRSTHLGSMGKAYEYLSPRPGTKLKYETWPTLWEHLEDTT